jgi:hypothetical protein
MFLTEPSLSSLSRWVASFTNYKVVDEHIKNKSTNTKNDEDNERISCSSDQSTVNTPTTYTPLTLFFPLSATSMIIPPLSIDTQKVKYTHMCTYIYIWIHKIYILIIFLIEFTYTSMCIFIYFYELI